MNAPSEPRWFIDQTRGVSTPVLVDDETVWMTRRQIGEAFGISENTAGYHLKNLRAEGEIQGDAVRSVKALRPGPDGSMTARVVQHFNLDAILGVGYRVNSKRGSAFRQWATTQLTERMRREIDERRAAAEAGAQTLARAMTLLQATIEAHAEDDEAQAILRVVDRYTRAFTLLLQYDEGRLPAGGGQAPIAELTIDEARDAVALLKGRLAERDEDTDLFAQERNEGLDAVIGALEQTFGGEALYPTWQARAAHLLYTVIKNHPFADGNKRIASFLFLRYLDKQGRLWRQDGTPLVADNGLVAIALLIAESEPAQREIVLRLIHGLIADA